MDEFPWHGMFIEIIIDYWSHRQSNDVLIWRLLLFKFNVINCNEVQYFLVSFFDFDFNFEFISCIFGDLEQY